MVLQEGLNSWREAVCFDSMPGKPRLPFNVRVHLQGYLWLCYDVLTPLDEFTVAIAIDMLLNL